MALRPQFTMDISLGQVMQALVVIGGFVITSVGLRGYFDDKFNAITLRQDQHEYRIQTNTDNIKAMQSDNSQFRDAMRNGLQQALSAIADLKVLIVQKQDRR